MFVSLRTRDGYARERQNQPARGTSDLINPVFVYPHIPTSFAHQVFQVCPDSINSLTSFIDSGFFSPSERGKPEFEAATVARPRGR